jgi:tRNA-specific 2-thiouridylase
MSKRVAVAISGGVDSAVAACLLKEKGYEIVGVFMRLGVRGCRKNEILARKVCDVLNIELHTIDISGDFRERIIEYFINSYRQGYTPNPCIRCNKYIKFGELLTYIESLGINLLATGHYAEIKSEPNKKGEKFRLYEGKDKSKDQSYFLYNLTQEKLAKIIFPLGGYQKKEVVSLAGKKGLKINKEESQDICFISGDHNRFLKEKLGLKKGEIRDVRGKPLGEHQGLFFYTLGQRRGVNLGGTGPYYVVEKDEKHNILYVSGDKDDPRLYKNVLESDNVNWVAGPPEYNEFECLAKIRYNMDKKKCRIIKKEGNAWKAVFQEPVRAMASGQSVVFYDNEEVLGGGEISRVL